MGLPFGCYKAKYFKPSFCESRFWVDHVLYGKLFVKSCNVMYAGVFLLKSSICEGKEGPSFRFRGASLFHHRSISFVFLLSPLYFAISLVLLLGTVTLFRYMMLIF